MTPSGTEHVVHDFKGKPDGSTPYAGLIEVNGTLYGTTQYGGSSDRGTVFKMSTSGAEHVIYSFKGSPDGMVPYARLASVNGTLYGTTQYGGASGNGAVVAPTGYWPMPSANGLAIPIVIVRMGELPPGG